MPGSTPPAPALPSTSISTLSPFLTDWRTHVRPHHAYAHMRALAMHMNTGVHMPRMRSHAFTRHAYAHMRAHIMHMRTHARTRHAYAHTSCMCTHACAHMRGHAMHMHICTHTPCICSHACTHHTYAHMRAHAMHMHTCANTPCICAHARTSHTYAHMRAHTMHMRTRHACAHMRVPVLHAHKCKCVATSCICSHPRTHHACAHMRDHDMHVRTRHAYAHMSALVMHMLTPFPPNARLYRQNPAACCSPAERTNSGSFSSSPAQPAISSSPQAERTAYSATQQQRPAGTYDRPGTGGWGGGQARQAAGRRSPTRLLAVGLGPEGHPTPTWLVFAPSRLLTR